MRNLMTRPLTILRIDASARTRRSITRDLADRFEQHWTTARPGDRMIRSDLALEPPPHIDEAWISAAFTPAEERDEEKRRLLAYSDAAIAELKAADMIVMGVPMYNYGLPSTLKAWFDQTIRVDELFSFDLARGDWPLEPILSGKRLVVLSARGEFGFQAGGVRASMNHLDAHINTLMPFLGVDRENCHSVLVEYQEFEDDRFAKSRARAEESVERLVRKLLVELG